MTAEGIQAHGPASVLQVLEQTEPRIRDSALEKSSMMGVKSRHQAEADWQSFSC